MVARADADRFDSYAFVVWTPLVLVACALSIVIFIGLVGRNSIEEQREWWTRFGTWILIYAIAGLSISFASIFGPRVLIKLHEIGPGCGWLRGLKWGSIVGWLGTVAGGLLAGNSSKTSGTATNGNKRLLEILARLGGFVFLLGATLATATVLYFAVLKIATLNTYSSANYWSVFHNAISRSGWRSFGSICGVVVGCGLLFSWLFDINLFGLSQLYRNRLVRCYLGATRWTPGIATRSRLRNSISTTILRSVS